MSEKIEVNVIVPASSIEAGVVKVEPNIDKSAVLPPPPPKPKGNN